jgi:hypothetical protein
LSEQRRCWRDRSECRPSRIASFRVLLAAAFVALICLGLPVQADDIEPEPETLSDPVPESKPAPKAAPAPAADPAPAANTDGFRLTPSVSWTHGDHQFDLRFNSRFRWERWEAQTNNEDNIYGSRTRVSGDYVWKNRLRVFAEGQYANVFDLDSSASGAAGLYRANAHRAGANSVDGFDVRQLFVEGRIDADNYLRVGRQDIKGASAVKYQDGNWSYLKNKRLSQRLVGGVGWTNGERSYDGISARMEQDGHVLHLYVAEPTTGVFEIDRAYKRQRDVIFGGLDWAVERGTWLDNTELGAFFIGYSDDRDPNKVAAPFFGNIEVYTFGFSSLGVYPVGPGNLDVLLWGAFQAGHYTDSVPYGAALATGTQRYDQIAGAGIAEFGYQLPDVWGKPWLRTGVNIASGDSDTSDGNRTTFFNILPTNHLYYGYTDQLAFANLIDLMVQFKLSPMPKMGLELVFHQFWLWTQDDYRHFGSGAFAKRNLGFGRSVSNGSNNVGQEIDFVVNYKVNKHVNLKGGFAYLFGGGVFKSFPDRDTSWSFAEITLSY